MRTLTEAEKKALCAANDWADVALEDSVFVIAIENNPEDPDNAGEWVNKGQLVDYDDILDEVEEQAEDDTESKVDLEEILRKMKSGEYTDQEMSDLPCTGNNPEYYISGKKPVWAWDGKNMIIGYSTDDFRIVPYDYED